MKPVSKASPPFQAHLRSRAEGRTGVPLSAAAWQARSAAAASSMASAALIASAASSASAASASSASSASSAAMVTWTREGGYVYTGADGILWS